MQTHAKRTYKDQRLSLRVSTVEKATLEAASQSISMTTSEFVLREAMSSAEEILADRTRFVLPRSSGRRSAPGSIGPRAPSRPSPHC